jgi:hypothetical protein
LESEIVFLSKKIHKCTEELNNLKEQMKDPSSESEESKNVKIKKINPENTEKD